jgi:hypothetical protein
MPAMISTAVAAIAITAAAIAVTVVMLGSGGTIEAGDPHTGQVRGLSVALPPVSYLAAGQP